MEPRIQYAKTANGVRIAFWTLGEGTPFVQMPGIPWSHIQLEWQDPGRRRFYERLAEKRKLVRYDGRGTGLSERNVADYSLDAHMLDLQAVVESLGIRRFALAAVFATWPVAVTYAARHPEAVSHLILWCPSEPQWIQGTRNQALRMLREMDWELAMQALAETGFGWSGGEEAHNFVIFMRECVTAEAARPILEVLHAELDVTPVLSHVKAPTLIHHRRQQPMLDRVEVAKGLASAIPGARLVLTEGASVFPWVGDMEAVVAASDEFLGLSEPAPKIAESPAAGGLYTVLFTDVDESAALTRRLGDAKAREVLHTHERTVGDALRAHGGTEAQALGNGFMASFSSATRALECAIAMQRAFAQHNETAEEKIEVRIGLNAGEPIAEEEDPLRAAVNVAARITAKAAGGEILVANVVRELASGKGFLISDRGDVLLRGLEDPVRLYEVLWGKDRDRTAAASHPRLSRLV